MGYTRRLLLLLLLRLELMHSLHEFLVPTQQLRVRLIQIQNELLLLQCIRHI
jgi:hypothetical protein